MGHHELTHICVAVKANAFSKGILHAILVVPTACALCTLYLPDVRRFKPCTETQTGRPKKCWWLPRLVPRWTPYCSSFLCLLTGTRNTKEVEAAAVAATVPLALHDGTQDAAEQQEGASTPLVEEAVDGMAREDASPLPTVQAAGNSSGKQRQQLRVVTRQGSSVLALEQ